MASLFHPRRRSDERLLAHVLRDVPLFRDAPIDALVAIWRGMTEQHVQAGSVVCRRGEPGDRFYIVQSGSLDVRLGLDARGLCIRRLGSGDFVGEMALLTGQPRSADVVVVEDAVLWVIERATFDDLLASNISLVRALNHALCERVARMTLQLEQAEAAASESPAGLQFGPYRVIAQIGVGGMSAVYSAAHEHTGAAVAIKVLPAAWGHAPELRERLTREGAILSALHHPNVIRLLDVGTVSSRSGGGTYLAMEWIPHALDRLLRAQYPEPLSVARALMLTQGVAQGLSAIHGQGLVHRDVKPSNILLRTDGTPVLTDFGLAAALREAPDFHRLTPSNVIVGTADYLSPEQIAGLPVDGRSDIYSLGIVLYELLCGHVPFAGLAPLETLHAHVYNEIPPLPESIPLIVRDIVTRALQKQANQRFSTADELVTHLNAAGSALLINL